VLLVVVLTLLAAVTNAGSSVLQRKAHQGQVVREVHGLRGMLAALRHPAWIGGIALLPISSVLGALALSRGQVSVVQSLQCLELPMVLILSSLLLRHRLRARDWVSIVVMAVGMAVFLYALDPGAGHPGEVSATGWLVGAGGAALLVLVVALLGWYGGRGGRRRRAQLLGVAAGMSGITLVIGLDALSGIGRQERPIFGIGERAEILILARHRGDDRDPHLLAPIFLYVAALIEACNRAVCMGSTGDDAPKLEMIVGHVERQDSVGLELSEIDRYRLLGEEVYRYRRADEGIDKDQVVTGIRRVRDRQPRVAFHDGNVRSALRDEVEQFGVACDPDDVGIKFVIDDAVLGPRLAGETSGP
jgi:drug/metabolite transporter (DMT)-like permease